MFCRGVFQKNFLFQYKEKNSVFCGGSSPKKIVLHYTESKSPLWGSVFKKCSKNIIVLIVRTRNPDFLRFFLMDFLYKFILKYMYTKPIEEIQIFLQQQGVATL